MDAADASAAERPHAEAWRWIPVDQVARFVEDVLLARDRRVPVVAVTTTPRGECWLEPERLVRELDDLAMVVAFATGEATWALSDALPPRLDVYGGAARIWWPGLHRSSSTFEHPLFFLHPGGQDAVLRRVVSAVRSFWKLAPVDAGPDVAPPAPAAAPSSTDGGPQLTKSGKPILTATVTALRDSRVYLRAGDRAGVLGYADERLTSLADRWAVGDQVRVFVGAETAEGPVFSIQGLTAPSAHAEARAPAAPAAGAPLGLTKSGKPIVAATVSEVRGGRVFLRAGDHHGYLGYADERLASLATRWQVGDEVRVFVAAEAADGVVFSIQGLTTSTPGPSVEDGDAGDDIEEPVESAPARAARPEPSARPDPWRVIAEAYAVGDVVRGRVCAVHERYALIELLPGAAAFCHISELASEYVRHPEEVVQVGDRVYVELLALDPEARRATVSVRSAGYAEPLPAIAPGPGLPPFLDDADAGVDQRAVVPDQLAAERDAANADRAALRARLKEQNEQLVALRRELRSANDRAEALEARRTGDLDPLRSETAFLTAVRVEYARQVSEEERWDWPLLRMRVHRAFLDSVRALEGVSVDKIVEVCAQVACGRAHRLPGREVHVLRASDRGPGIVRADDDAKAWRCAIQVNTPSARRLHWWEIPGAHDQHSDSRVIEFASVGLHDDLSIPM